MANRRKTLSAGRSGSNRETVKIDYKAMLQTLVATEPPVEWGGVLVVQDLVNLLKMSQSRLHTLLAVARREGRVRFRKVISGTGKAGYEYSAKDVYEYFKELQATGRITAHTG